MGLADRVRAFLRPPAVAKSAGGYGGSWVDLWGRGQEYMLAPDRVIAPYQQVATVYVAATKIAEAISKIPVELESGEGGTEKRITDHPLLDKIENANTLLLGNQLLWATAVCMCLHGEAFWWPDGEYTEARRGGGKVPGLFWLLSPRSMREVVTDGRLTGWKYETNGMRREFAADEVVYFRRYCPTNEIRGMSPLAAATLDVNLEYKSASWNEKFYENGARPPFYVYSPPETSAIVAKDRADFQRHLEEEFAGLRNAHKAPVLSSGRELRPLAITQRDMDYLEGRRFSREQILAVYGVPPAVAGVFEYANYANSAEQKRYFWNHTIRPLAHLIEDTIEATLIPRYAPGLSLCMDVDACIEKEIPEDYAARIDSAGKLWALGIPLAQINERLSLGFDLDGVESADVSFLPFSVTPADQALKPPDPIPAPLDPNMPPTKAMQRARRGWLAYRARLDAYESGMARALVGVYNRAESHVLGMIPKTQASVAKDQSDLLPPNFGGELEVAALPTIKRALLEGGEAIIQELARDSEFDMLDPRVQQALMRRRVMIVNTSETTRTRLRQSIADGITKGDSYDELRQRVRDEFDGIRANARTIARTETNAAFADGRLESMVQQGVRRQQWLTAVDDLVRPSHRELDSAIAEIGSNQWIKGGQIVQTPLRYPHDPSAPPGETINCRCVTVPVDEDA